jgi:hypothetical protein
MQLLYQPKPSEYRVELEHLDDADGLRVESPEVQQSLQR